MPFIGFEIQLHFSIPHMGSQGNSPHCSGFEQKKQTRRGVSAPLRDPFK
jgi:hypothetical protein